MKPNYKEKAKQYNMYPGSFVVYTKTEDIYADIAKDVEARSDTSNYELDWPFSKGKNQKAIGLMKDESVWIIKDFLHWKPKHTAIQKAITTETKKIKRQKKMWHKNKNLI